MFKDKLNNLLNPKSNEQEGNNKKKIENLVFFVIVLIVTIVAINLIWKDESSNINNKKNEVDETKKLADINSKTVEINRSNCKDTEKIKIIGTISLSEKLEKILEQIQGVGQVKVFINYSESSEVVAMYNENAKSSTTEETDESGGVRKIQETDTQKDIIYQENNGLKTPMTKKIVEPKIEGAIITAKGANNIEIKTSIIQAVEAVTGLATHKIQVFEMQ